MRIFCLYPCEYLLKKNNTISLFQETSQWVISSRDTLYKNKKQSTIITKTLNGPNGTTEISHANPYKSKHNIFFIFYRVILINSFIRHFLKPIGPTDFLCSTNNFSIKFTHLSSTTGLTILLV